MLGMWRRYRNAGGGLEWAESAGGPAMDFAPCLVYCGACQGLFLLEAMHFIPSAIRGPLFMIVSTGSYVVNDTMMKLATVGLPPYEVLLLRGVAATA